MMIHFEKHFALIFKIFALLLVVVLEFSEENDLSGRHLNYLVFHVICLILINLYFLMNVKYTLIKGTFRTRY
jgi:hypothetical protein